MGVKKSRLGVAASRTRCMRGRGAGLWSSPAGLQGFDCSSFYFLLLLPFLLVFPSNFLYQPTIIFEQILPSFLLFFLPSFPFLSFSYTLYFLRCTPRMIPKPIFVFLLPVPHPTKTKDRPRHSFSSVQPSRNAYVRGWSRTLSRK